MKVFERKILRIFILSGFLLATPSARAADDSGSCKIRYESYVLTNVTEVAFGKLFQIPDPNATGKSLAKSAADDYWKNSLYASLLKESDGGGGSVTISYRRDLVRQFKVLAKDSRFSVKAIAARLKTVAITDSNSAECAEGFAWMQNPVAKITFGGSTARTYHFKPRDIIDDSDEVETAASGQEK